MKKIFAIALALATLMLSGCYGRIHTGEVGLRTDFNGTMNSRVEGEGFYTNMVGHMDRYTLKEVTVKLENLTPKAKDNLSLKELDMSVLYKVKTPQAVRDLAVKYTGMSTDGGDGSYYPSYFLVESVAKSEIADAVSKHDSLTIHTQRTILEDEVKKATQASLDASDPGKFEITRVVVRQVLTDPTVEASIRNVVAKGKELEAATLGVKIAEQNAQSVAKTANTLTPAFLQHEYNQALMKFAERGGTVILDGSSSSKMINITK